ncbi:hypothetical protein ACH5RR_030038 [Cinchona calisaya]|uniref:F-box domain-containing protein n=1 Tax=Cinchona calisaya TaxID=153742 RepID=A0ABD2YWQ0_9GENT
MMEKVGSAIKLLNNGDFISQLPDEILLYILSFVTFKEGFRTRILSKRWINLCTYLACLDFDYCTHDKIAISRSWNRDESEKQEDFVRRVNKVLQSHNALVLDEFKVRFELDNSSEKDINKWLQFAFSRKVKRLELDFSEQGMLCCYRTNSYNLACSPSNMIGLDSLKELSLTGVFIFEEIFNHLFHNCQFLECLLIDRCYVSNYMEISTPSPVLKHLEIYSSPDVESIIVRNANLVSLKLNQVQKLVLENVPKLIGLLVCDCVINVVDNVLSRLSCCLSKLEVLTLGIIHKDARRLSRRRDLPQLPRLKQLTLQVSGLNEDKSLLGLTDLIRGSPNLGKLAVNLRWPSRKDENNSTVRELEGVANYPLRHLKVFELTGYYGRTSELELVKFFSENAITLEKIIIYAREVPDYKKQRRVEEYQFVREYAKKQLKGIVPLQVFVDAILLLVPCLDSVEFELKSNKREILERI